MFLVCSVQATLIGDQQIQNPTAVGGFVSTDAGVALMQAGYDCKSSHCTR